jgi:pimeloyl-ACP methyl ester carboxylesterase
LDHGAEINVRVHGTAGKPRLIMSHGNGFAINGYLPLWRHFLSDFELVMFDFRNHGENAFSGTKGHDWSTFVDDFDLVLKAIDQTLERSPAIGLFHSLSAITSLLHDRKYGWPWKALVLFEPPILPPADHPLHKDAREGEQRVVAWALARPNRFKSPDELTRQWEEKGAFRSWVKGAHGLMARSVLHRETESGDYILTCPRELEAKIYAENIHPQLWKELHTIPHQVLVLGSDTSRNGQAPAKVARALSEEFGFAYVEVAGTTHLLMLEQPEFCARTIRDFLSSAKIAGTPR